MKKPKATDRKKISLSASTIAACGVIGLGMLGSQFIDHPASAASATIPIHVKLVPAIELTVNDSINFGTLAMTMDRGGFAQMDPNSNQLVIDQNSSLALAGGNPHVGRLAVKGASFPVSISIEDTVVNLTNGITTVTISGFNFLTANGGHKVTITPGAGAQSFTVPVGATLQTKPGQLEGTYTGTTRVFANFQ